MNEPAQPSFDQAVSAAYRILSELDDAERERAVLQLVRDLGVELPPAEEEPSRRPGLGKSKPGGWSGFYESSSGA